MFEGIFSLSLIEIVTGLLLVFLLLKPDEYIKLGIRLGKILNLLRSSDQWKIIINLYRELEDLPRKWMRSANIEVWEQAMEETELEIPDFDMPATTFSSQNRTRSTETANRIKPKVSRSKPRKKRESSSKK